MKKTHNWKMIILNIVLGIAAIGSVYGAFSVSESLKETQARLDALEFGDGAGVQNCPPDTNCVEYSETVTEMPDSETGTDPAGDSQEKTADSYDIFRKGRDDDKMSQIFGALTTWDSDESYNDKRQRLIDRYNISADSQLMSEYMPELSSGMSVDDKNLNSTYVDMDSYVTGIHDGAYDYMALVTSSSSNLNDIAEEGQSMFVYTVNADGQLESISGYTMMN